MNLYILVSNQLVIIVGISKTLSAQNMIKITSSQKHLAVMVVIVVVTVAMVTMETAKMLLFSNYQCLTLQC